MIKIETVIPDALDWNVRTCVGQVTEEVLIAEGLKTVRGEEAGASCLLVYGGSSRGTVLQKIMEAVPELKALKIVGGWRNPLMTEMITAFALNGNVPLERRTVGEIKKAPQRLPILHNYLQVWEQIFKTSGGEGDFCNQTIESLVKLPGPSFWEVNLTMPGKKQVSLGKSTVAHYIEVAIDPGHITFLRQLVNDRQLNIANVTGSRADGTFGLEQLCFMLVHGEERSWEHFKLNAALKANILERQKKLQYTERHVELSFKSFYEDSGPVGDELGEILAKYNSEELEAFQFASSLLIEMNLPSSVVPYTTVPHSVALVNGGWEIATV